MEFVSRQREINGFGLDVPLARSIPITPLPNFVPMIKGKDGRSEALSWRNVAIPMAKLFSRSGRRDWSNRSELLEQLKLGQDTQLVISGVERDQKHEDLWHDSSRRLAFFQLLAAIKPAIVTSPNYSVITDVVRTEDLYNMKRIAMTWFEMVTAGVPTALHVNARTNRDWERWSKFIIQHPEINAISFEFGTGAIQRINWYRDRLVELNQCVGRHLTLVLRGGTNVMGILHREFGAVVFASLTPCIKAVMRRSMYVDQGKLMDRRSGAIQSVDTLMHTNIALMDEYVKLLLNHSPGTVPAHGYTMAH